MSMQDPIADMLTRIRNAQQVSKKNVLIPMSKLKMAIANVLKQEGYIEDATEESVEDKPMLNLVLKYFNDKAVIESISRVSRPSLRKYTTKDSLPKVKGGLGIAIVTTSKGVMTDMEARRLGLGGEIICVVS
jgi:small subunit ribosomal protein S8